MLIGGAEATDEVYLKKIIRFWFKNRDFQHTWLEVVTALEAIGEQALADDIDRNYVVHSGTIIIIILLLCSIIIIIPYNTGVFIIILFIMQVYPTLHYIIRA